ncbi:hypothetical protein ABM187_003579 [Stenotrophomonas maltophilia]|uniref:hypothetical protein n=1 Tax=Stenotrophomonas maltophilia TaxID=40324 RepID=UPI000DA79A2E|nr:hypothetical protein [Stenotrophomonas maltophilia]MBH1878172.1 hypothetical protein [Stenotrophomonas maltophilia]PZS42744.1 hypothetical protein A7X60_01570 [Stenotrophomonas maltophilia]HDS1132050.1 hypothetical protein [Stenotrophomonas maltophilia]
MDTVLSGLAIAAFPLIFFGVLIPCFRGLLWVVDRILDGRDPFDNFKDWQAWVAWLLYFTGAFWSLGLAIVACSLFGGMVFDRGAA